MHSRHADAHRVLPSCAWRDVLTLSALVFQMEPWEAGEEDLWWFAISFHCAQMCVCVVCDLRYFTVTGLLNKAALWQQNIFLRKMIWSYPEQQLKIISWLYFTFSFYLILKLILWEFPSIYLDHSPQVLSPPCSSPLPYPSNRLNLCLFFYPPTQSNVCDAHILCVCLSTGARSTFQG